MATKTNQIRTNLFRVGSSGVPTFKVGSTAVKRITVGNAIKYDVGDYYLVNKNSPIIFTTTGVLVGNWDDYITSYFAPTYTGSTETIAINCYPSIYSLPTNNTGSTINGNMTVQQGESGLSITSPYTQPSNNVFQEYIVKYYVNGAEQSSDNVTVAAGTSTSVKIKLFEKYINDGTHIDASSKSIYVQYRINGGSWSGANASSGEYTVAASTVGDNKHNLTASTFEIKISQIDNTISGVPTNLFTLTHSADSYKSGTPEPVPADSPRYAISAAIGYNSISAAGGYCEIAVTASHYVRDRTTNTWESDGAEFYTYGSDYQVTNDSYSLGWKSGTSHTRFTLSGNVVTHQSMGTNPLPSSGQSSTTDSFTLVATHSLNNSTKQEVSYSVTNYRTTTTEEHFTVSTSQTGTFSADGGTLTVTCNSYTETLHSYTSGSTLSGGTTNRTSTVTCKRTKYGEGGYDTLGSTTVSGTNKSASFTVPSNPYITSRAIIVEITYNNVVKDSITITQAGTPGHFSIAPTSAEVSTVVDMPDPEEPNTSLGQSATTSFTVTWYYCTWSVSLSSARLSSDVMSGGSISTYGTTVVTITVSPPPSASTRYYTVTISGVSGTDNTETFSITDRPLIPT